MKQIRRSVFETNSSSTHALCVEGKEMTDNLRVNVDDNKVHVEFGEFGWGFDKYNDAYTKLQYVITMAFQLNCDCKTMGEFRGTDEFREINEIVSQHCNCDGVHVDDEIIHHRDWNEICGSVDHQSVCSFDALFKECTLEQFIFSPQITLIIASDGYDWRDKCDPDKIYIPSYEEFWG